jgi:hypothetical protein
MVGLRFALCLEWLRRLTAVRCRLLRSGIFDNWSSSGDTGGGSTAGRSDASYDFSGVAGNLSGFLAGAKYFKVDEVEVYLVKMR